MIPCPTIGHGHGEQLVGWRKKGKKFGLKEVVLILVALVLALVAVEAAVRIFHPWPMYPRASWADRTVGWTYKPGLKTRSTNHWREFIVDMNINSLGFRDAEPRPAPGGRGIVFLGDSFTAAHEVPRRLRWTELVARDLSRRLDTKIVSYNFAVSGYGPVQYWLVYRKFVNKKLPHRLVIVLAFAGNDFEDSLPGPGRPELRRTGSGYKLIYPSAEYVARQHARFGLPWYKRLHLYNLQRDFLGGLSRRRKWRRRAASWDGGWESFWKKFRDDFLVVAPIYKPAPENLLYQSLWRGPWGLTLMRKYQRAKGDDLITRAAGPMAEAYRRLRDLVQSNWARLLVIILPHRRVYGDHADRNDQLVPGLKKILDRLDYTRPSRRMAAILARLGIPHLDLTPILIKMGTRARGLTWPMDPHFTVRGNAWLARVVVRWILARGLGRDLAR
jgi:hypothetical protein